MLIPTYHMLLGSYAGLFSGALNKRDSQLKEENKVEGTACVLSQEKNSQDVQIWLKFLLLLSSCGISLQKTCIYREKHR